MSGIGLTPDRTKRHRLSHGRDTTWLPTESSVPTKNLLPSLPGTPTFVVVWTGDDPQKANKRWSVCPRFPNEWRMKCRSELSGLARWPPFLPCMKFSDPVGVTLAKNALWPKGKLFRLRQGLGRSIAFLFAQRTKAEEVSCNGRYDVLNYGRVRQMNSWLDSAVPRRPGKHTRSRSFALFMFQACSGAQRSELSDDVIVLSANLHRHFV
jgi:hypothetical protein